jgi:O-antigen/teichoic acid export membrane protein
MLDKIKSLSKQTLIYGTSTIVGRFLNFILVPFYTNVFPPSEYGIVAVIFAYIAFLNII